MTTDYTLVFDKLREVIETETAHVQLLVPNAAAEEVEEMKEIDEIRQVAEELAEPEPSLGCYRSICWINFCP